jgi:hypothetical protein
LTCEIAAHFIDNIEKKLKKSVRQAKLPFGKKPNRDSVPQDPTAIYDLRDEDDV